MLDYMAVRDIETVCHRGEACTNRATTTEFHPTLHTAVPACGELHDKPIGHRNINVGAAAPREATE